MAVSPVGLKNMITNESGENCWEADFFTVVDRMDFFVLKWDRGMQFDNIRSFQMDVIDTDLKLDFLDSKKDGRYLALTAGGAAGAGNREITLADGEKIQIGQKGNPSGLGGSVEGRYGIEYQSNLGKKGGLNIKMGSTHGINNGYFLDSKKVNAALAEEEVAPDKIRMSYNYLTPSLELSRNVNKKDNRPVKLSLGVKMNIPLYHSLNGGRISEDLKNNNRNLMNFTVKVNF